MTPSNSRADLQQRFTRASRNLLESSQRNAADVANTKGMNYSEIHAMVTVFTEGTCSAQRFARSTGTTVANVMNTMQTLAERDYIAPEMVAGADAKINWPAPAKTPHIP